MIYIVAEPPVGAGFPCQAFWNPIFEKAWKDTRSQVFFPLLNILKHKQIPCILFENVQGLVSLKKGQMLNTILTSLKDLNYECSWKVLNCLDYGIPQNRKRLFIVGFHKLALLSYHRQSPGRSDGDSHIFEFPPKIRLKYTLSELLNKNLTQEVPQTIRGGSRGSPLGDRPNWDGYILSNSKTE